MLISEKKETQLRFYDTIDDRYKDYYKESFKDDYKESKWSGDFVVYGNPVPWKRAGLCHKRIYDSQKNAKLIWGANVKKQCGILDTGGNPVYEHLLGLPLHMIIYFFMPIPHYKRKKIKPWDPHYITPDLSNLIKFVEDVCTGIVYKDDSLITRCTAFKVYDLKPRTEFKFISNRRAS